MLYEYLTLDDDTLITYSGMLPDGSVRVCVERWNDAHKSFDRLEVNFPSRRVTMKIGFTEKECERLMLRLSSAKDDLLEKAAQKKTDGIPEMMSGYQTEASIQNLIEILKRNGE